MEEVKLKASKGTFEIRGIVFGMSSQNLIKVTDKGFVMMNFGVRVSNSKNVYLSLNSSKPKQIIYSKSEKGKDGKYVNSIEKVDYGKPAPSGFRPIGVSMALAKGEDGKNVEPTHLHAYDAIDFLKENLKDGMSVFVKGEIKWSSYPDKNTGEIKKSTDLVPNAIYLAGEEYKIDDPGYKDFAEFIQPVIFMGGEKFDDRYYIDFGNVGYRSYEEGRLEVSKVIYDAFKERMRPYYTITVTGKITTEQTVEQVEVKDDDIWGEKSSVGIRKTPSRVKLYVDGARGNTLDRETYSKKVIEEYRAWINWFAENKEVKSSSFNSQDDFGNVGESSKISEEVDSAW